MKYKKLFDLPKTDDMLKQHPAAQPVTAGDRRDGLVYLYTGDIELTINVALATGRPILLRGPSGSGKSSLARNIALRMGRRYYEEVVTSKTEHTDLQWRVDLLRRFRDAQANDLQSDHEYVEPRALWWAFSPDTASRRGLPAGTKSKRPPTDSSDLEGTGAVVLIDEIDKADPDVPNNLLVTLGSLVFAVPFLNDVTVRASAAPLVLITSNDERALPVAFIRRCITLELQAPDPARLVDIAEAHFGAKHRALSQSVADILYPPSQAAPETSTAEYLDAVHACLELGVRPKPGDPVWDTIVRTTITKTRAQG